ncbi:hypothetical protein SNEBB_002073 [Seison nebaliae]|nr:hypothetical protein SNEBB_002073 [Seison nebaliae]
MKHLIILFLINFIGLHSFHLSKDGEENYCENGGRLIDNNCFCPFGFIGERCEICYNECHKRPCDGNSVCIAITKKPFYRCQCDKGFTGSNCQVKMMNDDMIVQIGSPINNLKRSPCSQTIGTCGNGGICHDIDEDNFWCECRSGFTGIDCQINIDNCAFINCGVDSNCIDLIDGYICQRGNYENHNIRLHLENEVEIVESNCNEMDMNEIEDSLMFPIIFNPQFYYLCLSNGNTIVRSCHTGLIWNEKEKTCVSNRQEETCKNCFDKNCKDNCQCLPGFTGIGCEEDVDECLQSPCLNNSTCINYLGGYKCKCQNKIFDSTCCCIGVENPCTKENFERGTFYFPHFDPRKYLTCQMGGYATVMECPNDQYFNKLSSTCEST